MTIVEFIKARIDEDEAAALSWPESRRTWHLAGTRNLRYASGSGEPAVAIDVKGEPLDSWEQIWVRRARAGEADHIARHDPARVLAEVAAKRQMVDLHPYAGLLSAPESCEPCAAHPGPCMTLRLLALPYADHPDFDQAWAGLYPTVGEP